MKNSNRPFASRVSEIVQEYLEYAREQHGKTQTDISEEIGLYRSGKPTNFLSLVKNGRCKMPVDKIEPFSRACGISDPSTLVEAVADEYYGPIIGLLKKYKRVSYSKSESTILGAVIDAKKEADMELREQEMEKGETRTEQQRAQNMSHPWRFDQKKLDNFKKYVKTNLLG